MAVNGITSLCIVTSVGFFLASGAPSQLPPRDEKCRLQPNSKHIGDRATCPFTTTFDVDPKRCPEKIIRVSCNCSGSLCSDSGDFRCTEAQTLIPVLYSDTSKEEDILSAKRREGAINTRMGIDMLLVSYACVCSTSRSLIFLPDDVSRPMPIEI
ncbi:hypothetical protein HPB48_026874 [Haemaphysalis longicornis]|uniref:Uncharacterized protein n=1 Tax=Haemaphysalis longicornis TaxID=44386 RepID=A0A9J6HCL0_HAELO|nr:hypothetical protein HPB48_026874 [Haemaphysalis longicornis]